MRPADLPLERESLRSIQQRESLRSIQQRESLRSIQRRVFAWTETRQRPLPWRGERDPYRVLVSEVMLQQTQAARVAPAYVRFLEAFPTVHLLADAEPAGVLRAWADLGYPRRALNLWRAARTVVDRRGFPADVGELEGLAGVGPYTARAVASFAFGVDVAAVDANVRRVLTRLRGLVPGSDVQVLADALVPRGRAPEWNQAMIDLGAEVCRARAPRCGDCPVSSDCAWRRGVRPAGKTRRPQPNFADTTRYARGRVMDVLRTERGPVTVGVLAERSGLAASRLRDAVSALERDGLVHMHRRRVVLGPAASVRDRAAATRR